MKTVADKIILYEGTSFASNTYYIDDEKKVLVDASHDFKGKVDLLVLTHYHPDHIIYACNIKERTGCKVMIGEKDLEPLNLFIMKTDLWGHGKTIIAGTIKERDEIKTGTYCFKVIETPGHSKGSICLWEPEARILFSGDTKFAGTGVGRTDLKDSAPELMDQSLKRIESLKPCLLLPGHLSIERLS